MVIEKVSTADSALGALNRQPVAACIIYYIHALRSKSSITDQNRRDITVIVKVLEHNRLCSPSTSQSGPNIFDWFVLKAYAYSTALAVPNDLLGRSIVSERIGLSNV